MEKARREAGFFVWCFLLNFVKNSNNMKVSSLFLPIVLIPGLANAASPSLKERLLEIIGHDKIGVAIVYDNGTEMALDGNRRFPMMSLAKFHQAIALASELGYPAIFTDTVKISPADLLPGTWSPLRARYPEGVDIPMPNLLNYTLNMSDNNGADVLFNYRLSPQQVDSIVKARYGVHDFAVTATEAQMHADHSLAATNYTTPLGAARLFQQFFHHRHHLGGRCGQSRDVHAHVIRQEPDIGRYPRG